MESIQLAVKERLNLIIAKSNFLGTLTDRSQARKTGGDKELVLQALTNRDQGVIISRKRIKSYS